MAWLSGESRYCDTTVPLPIGRIEDMSAPSEGGENATEGKEGTFHKDKKSCQLLVFTEGFKQRRTIRISTL